MPKLFIPVGVTSWIDDIFIQDSSQTDGRGLTGLVFNSAGLTWYYKRQGDASWTQVTLATQTVGTWATGGFIESDATHAKGWYEIGIPNAVLAAAAGVHTVAMAFQGATNMVPVPVQIQFVGQVNELAYAPTTANTALANTTRVGGTVQTARDLGQGIPNAVPGAAGGLFIAGANAATSITTALTANLTGNVTGNLSGSVGSVTAAVTTTYAIKKNAGLTAFPFVMTDSTTGAPKTGLTVTATRSLDGAAFGACANAVTELSNGVYLITLAAADLNANTVTLQFTAAGANTLILTLITQS